MPEQKDYKKITVGLIVEDIQDTRPETIEKFKQNRKEKEDLFSSLILEKINETIGNDNWAVVFDEITYDNETFEVDIYCPEDYFDSVRTIIKNQIEGIKFIPEYKGIIRNYISTLH